MAGVVWFQLEKQECLSHELLIKELRKHLGITSQHVPCKFFQGTHEIFPGSCNPWPENDAFIRTTISLAGGKGGFGSMLRAIGAQIEKTTNREACRDLSGRRLRDINEEKRLKDWVSKQAEREQEREERKKKKLDKLRQEFHHEFHDPEYFKERSEVTDKVYEALEQGIQASSSGEPSTKKRKAKDDGPAMKKTALWVGVSDDDSGSDSQSEDDSKSSSNTLDKKDIEAEATTSSEASNQRTAANLEQEEAKKNEAPVTPATLEISGNESVIPTEPLKDEGAVSETIVQASEEPPAPVSAVADPVVPSTPSEPTVFLEVNLDDYDSYQALESLGLNHLKNELQRRGLKCGGSLSERAYRLFSVKNISPDKIDPSLLAKPTKKK
uniref:EOG090X0OE5 n=1 Tax=Simocephalus serrulatus TaxID=117539 RepID=A0A4Y7NQB5_9CRUS|nr:EOG090X0OE5 [Simocephalus serrulatus]SVE94674.1 EOG090X0OE5 [Simocephalus serrulatus]